MRSEPDRRDFAGVMLGALAVVGVPVSVLAQAPANNDANRLRDALMTLLKSRFGKVIDATEFDEIVQQCLRDQASGRALARYPLTNEMDPIVAFRADLP